LNSHSALPLSSARLGKNMVFFRRVSLLQAALAVLVLLFIGQFPSAFVAPLPRGTWAAAITSEANLKHVSVAAEEAAASKASGVAALLLVTGAAGSILLSARRGKQLRRQVVQVLRQARGGNTAPIVVISGPPAAGKGTQCEKIKEKFGYVHVSTGDILRANVKEGTQLGKKAEEYMTAGKLVPSELIVDLVKDRLAQSDIAEKGCLLDGFPRAPDQAQAMVDAEIAVDKFILIEVPDDVLVERGCGRRLDRETGEIYHLKFKPPPEEIMDRLVHRSDDQEESIRERLSIYHEQVTGILPFFEKVVSKIDGLPKPAVVTEAVFAALE